jgi:hypothetical protein
MKRASGFRIQKSKIAFASSLSRYKIASALKLFIEFSTNITATAKIPDRPYTKK